MVETNMGQWTYNLLSELKSWNMIFKILQIWLFCNSLQFYINKINKYIYWHIAGADPENAEREDWVPHPPPHEWKLYFSGHAEYSIVGVFVMQIKVTLLFPKIELNSILQNDFQSKLVL